MTTLNCTSSHRSSYAAFISTSNTSERTSRRQSSNSQTCRLTSHFIFSSTSLFLSGLFSVSVSIHAVHIKLWEDITNILYLEWDLPNSGNRAWWLLWGEVEVLKLCRGRLPCFKLLTSDSKSFLLKALTPHRRALLHRFLSLLWMRKGIKKYLTLTWQHNQKLMQFKFPSSLLVCILHINLLLFLCACLFAACWIVCAGLNKSYYLAILSCIFMCIYVPQTHKANLSQ